MDDFLNVLKGQAAALDLAHGQVRLAIVASVDPAAYTARVMIEPEGVLTGWLPIASGWVGGGWGLAAPPTPGDQVVIVPQEGDPNNGIIVGRLFSSVAPAPVAPIGEIWVVHKSGTFLKLHNDGTVEGVATSWNLTGDLHVQGDVYDSHGPMSALRNHYNAHTHSDPQGGTVSTPKPQD